MKSYMEHIPEQYHESLRQMIDQITETKMLLDQVQARFGTKNPDALRELIGQTFEAVEVTETSVSELETLIAVHEQYRTDCQQLMDRAAHGAEVPAAATED